MIKNFTLDKYTIRIFAELCEENAEEKFTDLTVAYGAISDDGKRPPKPVGIIIGHPTLTDFVIDWIYVDRKYRRKGIATALFERMAEAVASIEYMEGILAVISEEDDDLYQLLLSEGSMVTPAEGVGQFHSTLAGLKLPAEKGIVRAKSTPLSMVPAHYFINLWQLLENSAEGSHIPRGVPFPIRGEAYDESSRAILSKEEIAAIILLEIDDDAYRISWLYSKPSFSKRLIGLLQETAEDIITDEDRSPEEIPVVFGSLNDNSMGLAEKLFPEAEFEQLLLSYLAFDD